MNEDGWPPSLRSYNARTDIGIAGKTIIYPGSLGNIHFKNNGDVIISNNPHLKAYYVVPPSGLICIYIENVSNSCIMLIDNSGEYHAIVKNIKCIDPNNPKATFYTVSDNVDEECSTTLHSFIYTPVKIK